MTQSLLDRRRSRLDVDALRRGRGAAPAAAAKVAGAPHRTPATTGNAGDRQRHPARHRVVEQDHLRDHQGRADAAPDTERPPGRHAAPIATSAPANKAEEERAQADRVVHRDDEGGTRPAAGLGRASAHAPRAGFVPPGPTANPSSTAAGGRVCASGVSRRPPASRARWRRGRGRRRSRASGAGSRPRQLPAAASEGYAVSQPSAIAETASVPTDQRHQEGEERSRPEELDGSRAGWRGRRSDDHRCPRPGPRADANQPPAATVAPTRGGASTLAHERAQATTCTTAVTAARAATSVAAAGRDRDRTGHDHPPAAAARRRPVATAGPAGPAAARRRAPPPRPPPAGTGRSTGGCRPGRVRRSPAPVASSLHPRVGVGGRGARPPGRPPPAARSTVRRRHRRQSRDRHGRGRSWWSACGCRTTSSAPRSRAGGGLAARGPRPR